MCEEACPVEAIELTGLYDLTGLVREEMIFDKTKLLSVYDATKDQEPMPYGKAEPRDDWRPAVGESKRDDDWRAFVVLFGGGRNVLAICRTSMELLGRGGLHAAGALSASLGLLLFLFSGSRPGSRWLDFSSIFSASVPSPVACSRSPAAIPFIAHSGSRWS